MDMIFQKTKELFKNLKEKLKKQKEHYQAVMKPLSKLNLCMKELISVKSSQELNSKN